MHICMGLVGGVKGVVMKKVRPREPTASAGVLVDPRVLRSGGSTCPLRGTLNDSLLFFRVRDAEPRLLHALDSHMLALIPV